MERKDKYIFERAIFLQGLLSYKRQIFNKF